MYDTPVKSDLGTILYALNHIGSESSTKAKERLLTTYMANDQFATIVDRLLNPYLTYGITSFQIVGSNNPEPAGFDDLIALLERLRTRALTGTEARLSAGQLVARGVPGELMLRILNKDPKAGFRDTLVNKVKKGFLPEFPYMRCSLPAKSNMAKWDWSVGIISQLKADGMFTNVSMDEELQVEMSSRNGTMFPQRGFESLIGMIQRRFSRNSQTHGELVVFKDGKPLPRQIGNGMINSVIQGGNWEEGCYPVFFAWDQIPLDAVQPKGKHKLPYINRLRLLSDQLHGETGGIIQLIETRIVYSLKEAYEHFKEKLLEDLEGTIVKHPDAIWADGTSKDQVKLKLEFTVDLRITGFTEGKGKFATTFGALECETEDGKLEVNVSGMADDVRFNIHLNRDLFRNSIVAVTANMLLSPSPSNRYYSLFLPRVAEFRTDKHKADTLAQVQAQYESAIENAAAIA